jgi:outer membrane protein assembly factor BamE (lipoprotein component of BamABCDE complex)
MSKQREKGADMKSPAFKIVIVLAAALSGCSATDHARSVQEAQDGDRLTVGTVQREIREGMSGAEVVEVLGSPNVVTTDEKRREVWVYDKISTESVHSASSGGIAALIFGPIGAGGAGGLGTGSYSSGASSKSQRTFTVVIKFNEQGSVRDFEYHTSRF